MRTPSIASQRTRFLRRGLANPPLAAHNHKGKHNRGTRTFHRSNLSVSVEAEDAEATPSRRQWQKARRAPLVAAWDEKSCAAFWGPCSADRKGASGYAAAVIRRGAVGAPRRDRLRASAGLPRDRFSLARLQRYIAA